MDKELYDLMDWSAVEELVYSESENPYDILGPHPKDGKLLIQAFLPGAEKVSAVLSDGTSAEMEKEDENGFFACLLRDRTEAEYRLHITYGDGREEEIQDPYAFAPEYDAEDLKKFSAGNHTFVYEKMGAHPEILNGVSGVSFSVWAPNALRVSVVGDFNGWDGRRHQMRKLGDAGVFQLFIPGVKTGDIYKYEIKAKNRDVFLKADPYAFGTQVRPDTASVVTDITGFSWDDDAWLLKRAEDARLGSRPVSVYELNLCAWKEGLTYRELAEELPDYVSEMHYTHVEFMPVMEHPLDASLGYEVTGYYAPTSRLGAPEDFAYLVNALHKKNIGVILDWPGARFPKDDFALAGFDGTNLYELSGGSADTAVFNYGRPEVANFLGANIRFWSKEYHVDGFRVVDMSSILYFNSRDGRHTNLYGGGENLDGANFLRRMTAEVRKHCPGTLIFADGSAEWPMTTRNVKDDGLGFDYRWNIGWADSFLNYLKEDDNGRSNKYGELTFSMLYQYSENYLLPLSHAQTAESAGTLIGRIPGASLEERFADLRAAAGYFMTHPGKKLLFSGQEFGMIEPWNAGAAVSWDLLDYPVHRRMKDYVRDLNAFYLAHPALWKQDDDPAGFEWINCHSWKENVVVFLRHSREESEDLLVAVNFSGTAFPKFDMGVPYYGNFREVLNSDDERYGGTGLVNSRAVSSKALTVDERTDGITVKLPAHSVVIFACRKKERPAQEAAVKAAEGVKQAADTASQVKDAAVKKASSAKKAVTEKASSAKDAAVKKASSAKKAAAEKAAEIAQQEGAAGTAVRNASAVKKAAVKKASSAKKAVTEKASSAKKTMTEKAASAKKAVTEKASSAKKAASEKASELAQREGAVGTAVKKAAAMKEAAAKKAVSAKKAVTEKASSAKKRIGDQLRGNEEK